MDTLTTEARSYYGPDSPHSAILDDLAARAWQQGASADLEPRIGSVAEAIERLQHEQRTNAGINADQVTHGGYLAPLTLSQRLYDAFADAATSASPIAALFTIAEMPRPGGLTLNIPAMTTSVSVGVQVANADAISEATEVTATISAPVATLSGLVTVSWQATELLGGAFDELIARACGNQYGAARDAQLLNGSGSSGQTVGVRGTTSPGGNFTDTQASPTPVKNLTGLAKTWSLTSTGRKRPANAVIMHPRRWAFMANDATVAFNPLLQSERVVLSTDVPTNLGGGTNQDQIVCVYTPDLMAWEVAPQIVTAFDQSAVATGQVKVVVHGMIASPGGNRYPSGVGIQDGTDLVAPSGF